ncbi:MAG TPA: glycine reductase, partial [Clostridiaceae bacterium]|nr:glycine reductase [Clostridiaceae bacterium]
MPEDEFYGLLKISDSFELVMLEKEFAKSIKEKLSRHPVLNYMSDKVGDGVGEDEILKNIRESNAEKLELDGRIIGCVKRAHEFDPNL